MTNKALELYFEEQNIQFARADVGDKYVLNSLVSNKWQLGGEPSGHIICLDSAPTGDAIIAALKVLNAIKINNFSLEKSLEGFTRFPQTLINLKVNDPNRIILSDKFWSKVTKIEKTLGDKGRVLIRPSGTEPLIRLMVESNDSSISEDFCNSLAKLALEI
jgi:phosphoglucosamine mutase